MRRAHRFLMFVTILSGILFWQPLRADDFVTQKGPLLHRIDDKLTVRLQEPRFHSPVVEWREKAPGETKKEALKPDGASFWEANLPSSAAEYRIVDGERATVWHAIVPPSPSKDSFTFVAYGDNRAGWGNAAVHRRILANIRKESPSFILHTGDIVYNGDRLDYWQDFFEEGRQTFATFPFQPSIGNHDLSKTNRYGQYFNFGDQERTYYYFRFGRGHFIALDTALNFSPKSPQYEFLVKRLEKIKGDSPIVVFFHHPAYSFSNHNSDPKVQAYLIPLFEKYGVDLVLTGHDHNYQRFGPINGVTYIVTGGGGGPLYDVRDNPLHQYYKVVHHYLLFEVGEKSMIGTMKYRKDAADDRFEIPYEKKEEPRNPEEQRVIDKLKP